MSLQELTTEVAVLRSRLDAIESRASGPAKKPARQLPRSMRKEYATVAETLAELSIARTTLYEMIERGELVVDGTANGLKRITRASIRLVLRER